VEIRDLSTEANDPMERKTSSCGQKSVKQSFANYVSERWDGDQLERGGSEEENDVIERNERKKCVIEKYVEVKEKSEIESGNENEKEREREEDESEKSVEREKRVDKEQKSKRVDSKIQSSSADEPKDRKETREEERREKKEDDKKLEREKIGKSSDIVADKRRTMAHGFVNCGPQKEREEKRKKEEEKRKKQKEQREKK